MGSKLSTRAARARSASGGASGNAGSAGSAGSAGPGPLAGLDLPVFPDCVTTEAEVQARYARGRKLGEGAFATVYEVEELASRTNYAMKEVLLTSLAEQDSRLPSLRREVAAQRGCAHPHVLSVVDVLETDRAVYIVSELMPGGELFDLIAANQWRGWASDEHPRAIFRQILEALVYLHEERRTLHGDVKPENVICSVKAAEANGRLPEGAQLKLIDFGFARQLPEGAAAEALAFEGMGGTMEYCAPEVLSKEPYGLSADMWSAGVVLYLLCCGELPVTVHSKQDLAVLLRGNFPMEGDTWSAVSAECKDLVSKLLVRVPGERLTARQALEHGWVSG